MKKLFFLLAMLLTSVGAFAQGQYRTVILAKLVLNGNSEVQDMYYPIRAYVGDELRGEFYPGQGDWGGSTYGTTHENNLYQIEVWTNPEGTTTDPDKGKSIRLELVDYSPQYELTYSFTKTYKITGTENTYGGLESPELLEITLPKREEYYLPLYEVEKGKNYTLADYLVYTTGATLPNNVTWEVGTPDYEGGYSVTPVDGITIENGVLKVANTVAEQQVKLQLVPKTVGADGATGGFFEPLVFSYLNIVLHVTKITLKPESMNMSIENSDYGTQMLNTATVWAYDEKAPYIVAPEGYTDRGIMWEVEGSATQSETAAPLVQYTGNGFYITKGMSGTARVRPYIEYMDGNSQAQPGGDAGATTGMKKIVPTDANGNETWITIDVFVPVEAVEVNTSLYAFEGDNDPNTAFKANKSDKNIYERLAKMVKILPENANQKFHFEYESLEGGDPVLKIEGNKITALKDGKGVIRVVAEGKRETTMNYTDESVTEGETPESRILFSIEDPATTVNFTQNPLVHTLTDNKAENITALISNNFQFDGNAGYELSTGAYNYNTLIEVSITGDGNSVERRLGDAATAPTTEYWAVKDGVTDFIVKLAWRNWSAYNGGADGPAILNAEKTFSVSVGNQLTLQYLQAKVENNISGEEVTVTLTPVPANASDFNPATVKLTFQYVVNPLWAGTDQTLAANLAKWANGVVENLGSVSATNEKIVWKFRSPIAGIVKINGAPKPIQQPNVQPVVVSTTGDNPYVNIGYNLSLNKGWQWRSNPWGRVAIDQIDDVYGADLQEIRTSKDLLFNEKNYGMYGSLLKNENGIPMFESYKVKMAAELPSSVIFGNPLRDATYMPNNVRYDSSTGIVAVTLNKGWNWVGCPYFYNRTLETILAKAVEISQVQIPAGMAIVSKYQGFKEYDGQGWSGELNYLEAGQGYQIYNPSDAITLKFPVEMLYYNPANEGSNSGESSVKALGLGGSTPWTYDHSRFMNNMALVTVLEGISNPEDYSIGAFVGDECRGESYFEDGMMFITVHCDAGEYVKFRLYNTLTGETEDIMEGIRAQQRVGSLRSPFLMHGSATGIKGIDANASETESFDLTGRRTNGQLRGISIQRNANGNYRKIMK